MLHGLILLAGTILIFGFDGRAEWFGWLLFTLFFALVIASESRLLRRFAKGIAKPS